MNYAEMIIGLIPALLFLVAWIVALVFAIKMYRARRERPELFLLIGVSLMLAGSILSIASTALTPWLMIRIARGGIDRMAAVQIVSAVNIFRTCVSLGGIVLMVIAFWKKFKTEKDETAAVEEKDDPEI